jgi:acyl-[acyl-carrier-protein]-phospholipid O-acyltransferase/long-chain-fatty-acid--[acyl-carrier-protein] ligase
MRRAILPLLPDLIRWLGLAWIRRAYRLQVTHGENVPKSGGVLLLPNHVTYADAFFITAACSRPVRFVMDQAFSTHRSIRLFTGIFKTVIIRRDQPREAIHVTINALKNGDVVCLFPEGQLTRTGALCPLRRGFELIARKAGHPLVPMWCDGAWGSIFSFERDRFFKKLPYQLPYPLSIAFGEAIPPENANLESVRRGLMAASAMAIHARFQSPAWLERLPDAPTAGVEGFRSLTGPARRKAWINGHQIGQVNALRRRQPFHALTHDLHLPSLLLTFPSLHRAPVILADAFEASESSVWVGGDALRKAIETSPLSHPISFFDFSQNAIIPLERPGLQHFPCLAIDGTVVAMSMPDPPAESGGDPQSGKKSGTWGKLLPGWYPSDVNGQLALHGPAAPADSLLLPHGIWLDPDGFLANHD